MAMRHSCLYYSCLGVICLEIVCAEPFPQLTTLIVPDVVVKRSMMQLPAIVETHTTMVNDCANGRHED